MRKGRRAIHRAALVVVDEVHIDHALDRIARVEKLVALMLSMPQWNTQ